MKAFKIQNSASKTMESIKLAIEAAGGEGASIFIIHNGEGGGHMRGSSALAGMADAIIAVDASDDGEECDGFKHDGTAEAVAAIEPGLRALIERAQGMTSFTEEEVFGDMSKDREAVALACAEAAMVAIDEIVETFGQHGCDEDGAKIVPTINLVIRHANALLESLAASARPNPSAPWNKTKS